MKVIEGLWFVFQSPSRWYLVMPQSHCAESTPERGRIDHSSLFGGSFLVILVHSGNDNDNDNRFEQCSSCVCSIGKPYGNFEHVQRFVYPAGIIFILAYAHWECVVIVFVAQLVCCILVILTVYYVICACNISDEWSVNVNR